MTKTSLRYSVLAALTFAVALYSAAAAFMLPDLSFATPHSSTRQAANLWMIGFALSCLAIVALAVAAWRGSRAH